MMAMLIMIMRMSSGNGMHMTRFMIMNTGMSKQSRKMNESRPVGAKCKRMYNHMDHRMESEAPARRHGMNESRPGGNGIRPDGMEWKARRGGKGTKVGGREGDPARRERVGEIRPDGMEDRPGGNGNGK